MATAMHVMYEGEPGNKEPVIYLSDGAEARKLVGAKVGKWCKSIEPGTEIRSTSASTTGAVILLLGQRGAKLLTAHWHSAGIEKGLGPEEIANRFANLPEQLFRPLVPDPEHAKLRRAVLTRMAVLKYRKAVQSVLAGLERDAGGETPETTEGKAELAEDVAKTEPLLVKRITAKAKGMPGCIAFNIAAGIADSYLTASAVVALLGDMARFPQVSSLWHYCGYHVVDGKAPKLSVGKHADWNGRVRTVLWQWADSMLKTRNPKWRPAYDAYLAAELAVHDEKHPGCKTKQGHCGARARRRVIKDLLAEFWSMSCGAKGGRLQVETRERSAAPPQGIRPTYA